MREIIIATVVGMIQGMFFGLLFNDFKIGAIMGIVIYYLSLILETLKKD